MQDGFDDDTVVIKLNGKEVFKQANVNTKRQIGKACSFEVKSDPGQADIEITLPSRKLSEQIAVKVSGEVHLGISVVDGKIEHRISAEPFRYA